MRESNFAFPAQNRACVCITSQLYDRRALDTNAPLPLFNSLTHLAYLTSTSPRIREIMTMDGGLERLVKLLRDFCICPPPQENATLIYGLAPPSAHTPKLTPTLNPKSFDKHAAYRFSLAFQSVVNIGVRGSEIIRGRVVQAGTLDVVGCILEAWLASKGFAVGPGATMPGMQRETREQRQAKKQALLEAKQREQAAQLARALKRQAVAESLRQSGMLPTQEDEAMDVDQNSSEGQPGSRDTDTSTEPSSNATPAGSNTPTGAVIVPSRDRSGTVIARPVWDQPSSNTIAGHPRRVSRTTSRQPVPSASEGPSASHSTDTSRPETETEDDGDVEMDHDGRESDVPPSGASSPERGNPSPERQSTIRASAAHPRNHARRAVGIVSDTTPAAAGASMDLNTDAHIIINDQGAVDGVGVEDGIVSLETNDDFAMGAPPGAPGAINGPPATRTDIHTGAGERTPRAGTITLPTTNPPPVPNLPPTAAAMRMRHAEGGNVPEQLQRARMRAIGGAAAPTAGVGATGALGMGTTGHHRSGHHRDPESGPYRDEDVLLALQLLAYLSKYPHVRQAFYKQRQAFHPATLLHGQQQQTPTQAQTQTQGLSQAQNCEWWTAQAGPSMVRSSTSGTGTQENARENGPFFKVYAGTTPRSNGKEKEKAVGAVASAMSSSTSVNTNVSSAPSASSPPRLTNVFALVERFTYRPSSAEIEGPNPPPTLPPEIQYWASVIMRNACRKDDSRGGIRQCANMMCGKWESYPREFAKCRRCRKAKYCGKECQSIAWSEGHRFWCSAKDSEEDPEHAGESTRATPGASSSAATNTAGTTTTATTTTTANGTVTIRPDRRARDAERMARIVAEFAPRVNPSPLAQVAETVRQGSPLTVDRQGPPAQPAWFNALTIRRIRPPRVDDPGVLGANEQERRLALATPTRPRRPDPATAVPMNPADVELSPPVRRHLVQVIEGGRRPERIEVTAAAMDIGPSRIRDPGESDNDEPMVIG